MQNKVNIFVCCSCSSDVRIGHSLNTQEETFVKTRLQTVQECLKNLGIVCSPDKVPKIALLGSGGGERAMLGLLGSLDGFKETGLLDCVLYLSGVSGSTWCMASLYQDSDWSTKLDSVREKIIQRLKGPAVSWSEIGSELMKYYLEKDLLSLTDIWAVLVVTLFVKEIDNGKLSQQRGHNDKNPFPIYTVIDKQCRQRLHERGVFFEISPYEAGYSLTGAFVDNSMFGSQFEKGSMIKDQPEMDMLYLQGLCGSCLADGEFIIKLILQEIKKFFHHITHEKEAVCGKTSQEGTASADAGFQILVSLVEMHLSVLKEKDLSVQETTIRTKLKELTGDESWLVKMANTTGDNFINIKQFTLEVLKCLKSWFSSWWDGILDAIIKCVMEWIWGRKYNFLYKMEGVHAAILKSETRDYEDAGIALNSPYISMLRQERDVDLIISLDFSGGHHFETLTYASEICGDLDIPFPEVDVSSEDPKKPKDFYVFEGKGEEPTVIHIPLFNTVNCGDKLEEWREKYTTIQLPYSAELIDPLVEVSGKNITNNKEKLVKEIQKIFDRKHK
ncbi:cytosolic phospholipase A2 gamma-like isoform X2 [Triplophysa dalaica]|uniref:cytosolic phospholipase A2 gamma-like isoform X2 n=1 Tax=Triplophysa dalaica TaxID=1582913 RepID=UPI0024DFA4C1|nr:cytosolic phospholipase A2 gamma-like isoform X2 [Triplophysa dalaica]